MRRLILLLALAVLALPSLALAKGPSAATMEGPGGGGGITFSGDEGSGPLGNLTQQSGWFAAVFEQEPNPMLAARPKGDLGPKYTVVHRARPQQRHVHDHPERVPVRALRAGDVSGPGTADLRHGDSRRLVPGRPDLKETLVAAGLPETAAAGSSDDTSFPTTTVSLLAFALLLAGATALLLRRRAARSRLTPA